jgi:31-O-methyltransferase
MRSVVLPNDLKIFAPNELEARALYREIFIEKTYAPDGVNVTDGDCVFDVGANIGLYSIFLSQNHRDLKIYAFEPIPQTFSILRKNTEALIHNSRLEMFNFGLSNKSGRSLFEFDRFAGLAATMRPEEVEGCVRKDAGMRAWAAAGISDLQKISVLSHKFAARLLSALSRPLAGWLVATAMMSLIVLSLIRKRIFLQKIECELKTISDVIRERQVATIALVKIDVEGSEWDVIAGISEEDWPKIKQFVVEAHDVDGRVEKMKSVFESRGYRTVVSQEDWELHKLINAFTIIAVRN